jgi:hypothetical protein
MTGPLDMSKDPDRFVPETETETETGPVGPVGPLDPAADPDRYDAAGDGSFGGPTLPQLLGEGAHEDERDGLEWLYGLLGVLAFLLLVTLLAHAR